MFGVVWVFGGVNERLKGRGEIAECLVCLGMCVRARLVVVREEPEGDGEISERTVR